MLKIFLSVLLGLTVNLPNIYGQACGTGTFTIRIAENQNFLYELIPITPKETTQQSKYFIDWLGKTFSLEDQLKSPSFRKGFEVREKPAKRFLEKYKPADYKGFQNHLRSNKVSGISQNGIIQFQTGEVLLELYLLRITTKGGKTKYFIDNYLGGCDRELKVNF